jgi:hypothetical protein
MTRLFPGDCGAETVRLRSRALVWCVCFAVVSVLASRVAHAHPGVSAVAIVKVERTGDVSVIVRHDALAFALNDLPQTIADEPMYALLDGDPTYQDETFADAKERFGSQFEMWADAHRLKVEMRAFPTGADLRTWRSQNPHRRLPVKLECEMRTTIDPTARELSVTFPLMLGNVILTLDVPGREPIAVPILGGGLSPPLEIAMPAEEPAPVPSSASTPSAREPVPAQPIRANMLSLAWRYVVSGFEHIIPSGPDHALFVLGLFLLTPKLKSVLWQITAFTVAHTVTLTLTTLHIVGLPSGLVEVTIAASVAFIGVENLLTTKVHPWRPAVAFVFGLVHGMGVAGAFSEVGFPEGQLIPSLAAFTVGVEAGHLAMLTAAFLLLGWTREKPWYRNRVAIPLSVGITLVACVWIVQRLG